MEEIASPYQGSDKNSSMPEQPAIDIISSRRLINWEYYVIETHVRKS